MFGRKRQLTPGSGWNFAASVLASIVAAIILATGAIVLGILAQWLRALTELQRGILWGSAIVLFLAALVLTYLSIRCRQHRKDWSSGIYTCGPRIVFGAQSFHIKKVGFGNYPQLDKEYLETDVLSLHFKNSSDIEGAENLRIRFTCIGRKAEIRWIDARLDSFKQPRPGETPQVIFGLGPGIEDVASFIVKEPQSSFCYLFNSDSYKYSRVRNPMWELDKGRYKLLVEFIGLGVVRRFECIFINRGKGKDTLKIKSYRIIDLLG
jgi:hypothetical protein